MVFGKHLFKICEFNVCFWFITLDLPNSNKCSPAYFCVCFCSIVWQRLLRQAIIHAHYESRTDSRQRVLLFVVFALLQYKPITYTHKHTHDTQSAGSNRPATRNRSVIDINHKQGR